MILFLLLHLAFHLVGTQAASKPNDINYNGGIVEFNRQWDSSKNSLDNIMVNLKSYIEFINKAGQKQVDILVFPEYGLQSETTTEFIPVPDPKDKVTPRLDSNQHKVLQNLSEAAYNNSMYVVVNIVEIFSSSNSTLKYNTNVGFDRNGTVIARYRKTHLYEEYGLNTTTDIEYSYFDTDFGVRFGLFTCFDILFSQPALELINEYQVTDIAFPTAWRSELPFLTATQAQSSWAFGTGTNLLAAGLNDVEVGHSGSGIYQGEGKAIVYWLSEIDGSKLLHQSIKKRDKKSLSASEEVKMERKSNDARSNVVISTVGLKDEKSKGLNISAEDLTIYQTVMLDPKYESQTGQNKNEKNHTKTKFYQVEERICQGKLCCDFKLDLNMDFGPKDGAPDLEKATGDQMNLFRYRMVVFDGVRRFGRNVTGGVQVCGVIPCLDSNLKTCGLKAGSSKVEPQEVSDEDFGTLQLYRTSFNSVLVNGSFNGTDSFISPNVLKVTNQAHQFGRVPSSSEVNFTKVKSEGSIVLASLELIKLKKEPIPLVSAAIYGRLFSKDGQPVSSSPNSQTTGIVQLFLITFILLGASNIFSPINY